MICAEGVAADASLNRAMYAGSQAFITGSTPTSFVGKAPVDQGMIRITSSPCLTPISYVAGVAFPPIGSV